MKFSELKAHWPWMLEHISDDEPVVFPRRNAKKRAANAEKRSRIIFDSTPTGYQVFHTERERILLRMHDNPTLFEQWLCDVMQSWSDEMVDHWLEGQGAQQETLGDA